MIKEIYADNSTSKGAIWDESAPMHKKAPYLMPDQHFFGAN